MDATLEELWKKITFSEEEKGALSVNAQDVARSKEQAQFSLLFKLQTNREFNKEAFKSTIQQLWRGSQRVTIKDVGNNIFLAIFGTEEHMNDILDRSPWSFEKKLVMVKRFTNDPSPENVSFQRSPFWIRVFNIPIKSMNATVERYTANEIGVPLLVDAPKSGLAWGPFLCIRVDIDITKPLMRGKMLQVEGMEEGWVHFKYERLPIYCYRCGILGHQEREHNKAKRGCITIEEDNFQFGPWLRIVGTKSNQGKNFFNKTRSGVVEEDIDLESDEEEGGRQLSHIYRRQQIPSPISKPAGEIIVASSMEASAEISGCQVTSQAYPNLNSTDRLDSYPSNPEKPNSLSSSNSNQMDKPNQSNPEKNPSTIDINPKN
ncbi:hypothetical protein CMV_024449 [Castanea mollissima]|uniref:CCHC-type domain-containing protein n=1 Tax=Castanea mollissima TaxID=60419 RepID=A0A8J4QNR1_9ROSI|nr:hypothetical protein CMV_024449 [Castanea mollissima]